MNNDEIAALLKKYAAEVDEHIEKVLPKQDNIYGSYLNEPAWYYISAGGKRIRPTLCLLTANALGISTEKAMPYAVATELVHNFLIIHDDIMDEDTLRRGQPTIHVKYGLANGINVGDYILFKAYRSVFNSKFPKEVINKLIDIITLTCERTGEGQALDVNLRATEDFTVDKYLTIATLKTGYYLSFSIVGACAMAGMSDSLIEKMWKNGSNMGAAFQIKDDIIDLTVGKGRQIGGEIRTGTPTILYARALEVSTPAEKKKLVEITKKPKEETTDEDVNWVIGLYNKYGVINWCQNYASNLVKEAQQLLDEMPFEKKDVLKDIFRYMAERVV